MAGEKDRVFLINLVNLINFINLVNLNNLVGFKFSVLLQL